ncbi:MAG: NAD(P)H-hydrate epimerase [Clostridiaceae bacterium]|nr:NAD(P)H-hydrate epimerase [Clostridiaceae bacterium]
MEERVTAEQMKKLERAANDAGLSYRQMMENAGYQAFEAIERRCPHPGSAVVFAGKGNNAGDGFVVARLLAADGANVRLILCEGDPVTEDAAFEYERLADVEIWLLDDLGAAQEAELLACDVVVDALYGTGFHGALRPNGLRAADMMNRASGLVCSLDLPSGVNADTGEVADGAVKAGLTVTFHARKQGQDAPQAAMHCGEIVVADIGIHAVLRERRYPPQI